MNLKKSDPLYLEEAFDAVCTEMKKIFIKKHQDYGKGNILETGDMGILFRISDKLNRLKHLLITRKSPQNEPLEETWLDIGVYAVIAILYMRSWFKKLELKEKGSQT